MFVYTIKLERKKLIFIAAMAALIIFGIIMLAGIPKGSVETKANAGKMVTEDNHREFLSSLGWQVETPALSVENVLIPKNFSDVFLKYNEMQKSKGYDLSSCAGKEVELYTYKVTNHDSDDTVYAQLYIYKGKLVGGDIHSSSLDGFMTALDYNK